MTDSYSCSNMVDHFLETFLKRIKGPTPTEYKTPDELAGQIDQFSLKNVGVLIDGETDLAPLQKLPVKIAGYYSFNLELIDQQINGLKIRSLLNKNCPNVDGWIVSTTHELTPWALNQYLLDNDRQNQMVLYHVKYPNGTKYYSYADFFHDKQETLIHINNYFHRGYDLALPLALRLTLRDTRGKIVHSRQIILGPDCSQTLKSSEFGVNNFVGYLEVEFEIPKKVSAFLHYMVDYLSPTYISSNHQSCLGLHAPLSLFTRGYIPTEKDKTLEVCLFQRNYSEAIRPKAVLHYRRGKKDYVVEKRFKAVGKNEMLYQDVKALFGSLDFSKISAPYVEVQTEVKLHRPNYYYRDLKSKEYYDTSHAGPDLRNFVRKSYRGMAEISSDEFKKFRDLGIVTFDLPCFLLPKATQVETLIALGNDSTAKIIDFELDLFNYSGRLIKSFDQTLDYDSQRYYSLSEIVESHGLGDFSGIVSLRLTADTRNVPVLLNSISVYRHTKSGYFTSTAGAGSQPANLPFFFRAGPPNYLNNATNAAATEIFARGIANKEYYTYFLIHYPSGDTKLTKDVVYEVQVVNTNGQKRSFYRKISAHGGDFVQLSELLSEHPFPSNGGNYTVWFSCASAYLYGQHILLRKKDSSITVEHCYVGRFGL